MFDFAVFPNIIKNCIFDNGKFYDARYLCTFNSFMHGIIAAFKTYDCVKNHFIEFYGINEYITFIIDLVSTINEVIYESYQKEYMEFF